MTESSETPGLEKFEEIEQKLSAIRGLNFTEKVPIDYETKDAMRKRLQSDLVNDSGEENFKDRARAYAKLGLFPRRVDLKSAVLKLYAGQIAGFYDLKNKKIVLPQNYAYVKSELDENDMAHELTHALQDQHFSLAQRLGVSHNSDKSLAFRALAEGDAFLTELAYVHGGTAGGFSVSADRFLQRSSVELQPALSDVPAAVSEKLLFQYRAGAALVYRVLKDKGWPGVNGLYGAPPLSTKQVLHPEKYLDSPDPPTAIELNDRSSLFSPEWEEIENNTLGELMVRCLLKRFFPPEKAKAVASGWAGDRFIAFRRGDEISFIWATVWDSSVEAGEFFAKYQALLPMKYGSSETEGLKNYIEQRDRRVVVVEGLERDRVKGHIEKIWKGMRLEKELPAFLPSRP